MLTAVKNVTFRVEWEEQYSNEVPAGQVMEQSIPQGDELEEGQEYALRFVISMGPEPTEDTTQATTQEQTTQSVTSSTAQQTTNRNSKNSSSKKSDGLDGYIE